ncbi:MAG: MFS transporter [Gemmatimonadaceae bacterium]|nr:MFS transporter [Gemmatimonadaceae bacterium]
MSLYARSSESDPAEEQAAGEQAGSRNPFRVLREHRNFRVFWTGQTLSLIGTWMQTMAVGWLSLELSNSAFIVGLVASMGAVPIVLFSMHAGALVDLGNKLCIVRITQALFLLQAAVLFAVTVTGHVSIAFLVVLSLVQGCLSAVEIPARQSLIIQLVGRNDLQPAIAINSSGFNLARVLGPAVGGIVIGKLGIAWCFGLNAVSFGWVLFGLSRIRLEGTVNSGSEGAEAKLRMPTSGSEGGGRGLRTILRQTTDGAVEGLRHLMQPGSVRELLILVTIGAVLGGPFISIMPVVARDQLGLGAEGYGALLAMLGIGGLIGALLVAGPVSHRAHKGPVLIGAALMFPVLLLAFAYTQVLWLAYVLLLLTGGAMIMFNALSNGVLQLLVEERFRGRLMAFYSLVFVGLSQAVGAFALGALARAITASHAIGASAVVLAGASAVAWRRGRFWREI